VNEFFHSILRAKNGDLSCTRLIVLGVGVTLCAFVWGIIILTVISGTVPDIPAGTGAFLTGLLGIVAILKGVQNSQEKKEGEK